MARCAATQPGTPRVNRSPRLHVDVIGHGERTALIAHGILGMGRNWRTMARRMATRLPEWRFALADLRNHGHSQGMPGPHTVATSARDLHEVSAALGGVQVAVGHSFGGKVVLEWVRQGAELEQAWALDSPPGSREVDPDRLDTLGVLRTVRSVSTPAESRDAVREVLRGAGLAEPLVMWLLTSLVSRDGGWYWVWDLDAVDTMITDYLGLDLMPWLEAWSGLPIHLVRAGQSDRWSLDEIRRIRALGAPSSVKLHLLPNAGHWVHVDDPLGVLELFLRHWPGAPSVD